MRRHFERALVIGGAGFIGSHLCEHLLGRDMQVVCLDNFATGTPDNVAHLAEAPGFRLVEHDVTEQVRVSGAFDLVIHLASPASPRHYLRLPIETLEAGALGTRHALRFAEEHSARFLLASTSEVYGDPTEHPQRETYWGQVNPIGPRSVYDEAKRYAEALTAAWCRSRHGDVAIVRIFNTYGPRMQPDDGRMIPTFIRQALAGQPITIQGDGEQTRSVCYVDDTVRGLVAMAASAMPGPVNIGNPEELRVREVAERIRDIVASTSPITYESAAVDDPRRRCPDISLARCSLRWEPEVSLSDGLQRTIESIRRETCAGVTAFSRLPSGALLDGLGEGRTP
ncbi:MAG: NAD-dependent epimerase/dehydratase family protein [Actinophytocola sp.]|uniref:NAD-dependent epimerase/dehydratase family protein n=1 Tax=Actinophytocola sp. TaxID=1872138 RepID=UPI0013221847|nr:NAD-dependent epimerase/dehydratase family protein [Actinophytocola sp.]MPZ86431.1 NAD-dependent epimerase/dehydratase family protein [Actinophytocola sp.]